MHENKTVLYLQNCKYQDINRDGFRKPEQVSTNTMKNNYPKTAHTFFMDRSIFSYFLCLNYYNFRTALKNSIKLRFIEIACWALKTNQNSPTYSNPARDNGSLKIFKNCVIFEMFFYEISKR